jgi:hypothetical protein
MLFARDMRPMRQYARLAGEATIASSVHIAWDQRAIFWRSLISPNPELPRLLRNLEEDGAMPEESGRSLSVSALIAERAARRRRDREAAGQLERSKEEALTEFKKRLDNLQLTDEIVQSGLDRIKRAFERGESELMISAFPSSFCTDGGRAIINAGVPPINKPSKEEAAKQADEPVWLSTLPAGVHQVYTFWKENLKPGGFGFSVRIINYPGGRPGDVGLFFTWPKSTLES